MSFTEEELTQMAILKTQSLDKQAPGVNPNPKPEDVVSRPAPEKAKVEKAKAKVKPKVETAKPLEKVISERFKFSVDLGNNKTVHYTNWTGKTKKIFNKLLEQKGENISLEDISSNLIRNYIQEQDIYLSPLEEQYLIVKIRDVSLSEEYTYAGMCPHCDNVETITDKTSNIFKYKKSDFPKKIGDIEYVDINSDSEFKKTVESIQSSPTYDGLSTEGDIEIAMHLNIDNKTPVQVMDFIDTISLREIDEILNNLSSVSPDLKMGVERICKSCGDKGFFECDEIPNVFEELI